MTGWRGMNDFSSNVEQLEITVLEACAHRGEWPEKVVAGISAALDFAAANPDAARILAIDARTSGSGSDYLRMVELFSHLFASEAPCQPRLAVAPEQALVGGIAMMVAKHLRSGHLDRLGQAAPELVYLALLPYLGFDEAKRWASSAASPPV